MGLIFLSRQKKLLTQLDISRSPTSPLKHKNCRPTHFFDSFINAQQARFVVFSIKTKETSSAFKLRHVFLVWCLRFNFNTATQIKRNVGFVNEILFSELSSNFNKTCFYFALNFWCEFIFQAVRILPRK